MQRAIARPFRPSRRPVWSSHPYLLCRTFILVAGPDAATFPEADSLVPAVAPPRILPQSSASKKPAQIEREIPRLRRYARALTRSADRADDLVQETLLRAISKSHLWQTGTNIRAWLFTIMHNHYVNMVRRAMRDEATVD